MKTFKEILKKVTSNGMRELTEERAEQAAKEYVEQAIVEELIKAKSLTEHLNQESRNEYFDNRIKELK